MEVCICKQGWRRAWRYPAYLWSLRWVYAVKKNPEVGIRVNPRIPPNTPLQITHHTIHVLERRYKISHHTLNVTPRETIFKNCHIQEMSELTNCHPRISPWEVCSKHTCLVIDTKTDLQYNRTRPILPNMCSATNTNKRQIYNTASNTKALCSAINVV